MVYTYTTVTRKDMNTIRNRTERDRTTTDYKTSAYYYTVIHTYTSSSLPITQILNEKVYGIIRNSSFSTIVFT